MDIVTFIICVAVAVTLGATVFLVKKIIQKTHNVIMSSSSKIADLLKLNQEISFHDVENLFNFRKHYDNKSNYNRIEPSFIMAAEIRQNIDCFSIYASKIKENRSKSDFYKGQVQAIWAKQTVVEYKSLKIPKSIYDRFEKKLFLKHILYPAIDCKIIVEMTYSSPKGKVNLYKASSFDFDEMFACLESVSRKTLDRATYSRLISVERGEISDSLRYDILSRDNFSCVICGASQQIGARLHVDHIIPVSKGGKSIPSNLRTLCERCNIGKSNKIESSPDEQSLGGDDVFCESCGAKMILRKGKYGEFYGCSNYPSCKFTKNI